jgi:hypothetical protein
MLAGWAMIKIKDNRNSPDYHQKICENKKVYNLK